MILAFLKSCIAVWFKFMIGSILMGIILWVLAMIAMLFCALID